MLKLFSLLPWHLDVAFAQSFLNTSKNTAAKTQTELQSIFQSIMGGIGNWVAALVVFFIFFLLAKVIKQTVINRVSTKLEEEHQDTIDLIGRLTYFGIVALGATVSLKLVGIDVITIMAAMGLGIGFALKDLILNFLSGVIILLSRQFTIGDYILINDIIGKVENIQTRCTILQALDGSKIIVPNSDLFNKQIISFTTNPFRRVEIQVGVAYNSNLRKVIEICLATMHSDPDVAKEPGPNVLCDQFADSSINFILRFWLDSKKNWLQIRSRMMVNIKNAFDQAGINIAFPVRTLYFANELKHVKASLFEGEKDNIKPGDTISAQGEFTIPSTIDSPTAKNNPNNAGKDALANAPQGGLSENNEKQENSGDSDTGAAFLEQITTP